MQKYTIDATDKKLGRLASEIAVLLMGKNMPDFQRNMPGTAEVHIMHAEKLVLPQKKQREKTYVRYSGYPGGIHRRSLEKMLEKRGVQTVIRDAVYNMLPANRLRNNRMKRLIIEKAPQS
jgi:large subunit ribosomal protein L13